MNNWRILLLLAVGIVTGVAFVFSCGGGGGGDGNGEQRDTRLVGMWTEIESEDPCENTWDISYTGETLKFYCDGAFETQFCPSEYWFGDGWYCSVSLDELVGTWRTLGDATLRLNTDSGSGGGQYGISDDILTLYDSKIWFCPGGDLSADVKYQRPEVIGFAYVTVYRPDPFTHKIEQYSISADGTLFPLCPSAVTTDVPWSVTATPLGQYVYVSTNQAISQFRVSSDGTLSPLSQASVAATYGPNYITVDPSGQYVYVIGGSMNGSTGRINQYSISFDGTLSPLSPAAVAASNHPVHIAVHPSGRYVYITNMSSNNISQYGISISGTLSPLSPPTIATLSKPRPIAIHPSGEYAYMGDVDITSTMTNYINQYSISNTNGSLLPLSPPTVATGRAPHSIAIHASGQYVYVSNFAADEISQYTVGGDGTLSPLSPAAVAATYIPNHITVDPSGNYVYVIGANRQIYQYGIGLDGTLSPLSTPAVATSSGYTGTMVCVGK